MDQTELRAEMVRKLFQNKANFCRVQMFYRATYSGRSAFMRAKCLSDGTVQESWNRLVNEWELHRGNVARELNVSASGSFILGFYCSKRR